MLKVKKYLKLGTIFALSAGTLATTSLSSYSSSSREYIDLTIDGDKKTFESLKDATNYVMSNKVHAEYGIKIGTPEYFNKNIGWIDPSSLHEYKADGKSMAPAYKMMNGKYTRNREKALKSYLGRSHLVGQYYDGQKFHDGNSIGLKEAKDAILSRQIEEVVPYYDVTLSGNQKVRINPFNKDDIHYLQDEAFNIYKKRKDNNSDNSHVTTSYLLPSKIPGKKILVLPNNPSKGLQVSDLFDGKDMGELFKDWVKSKIRFDFNVSVPKDSPYVFLDEGGKWNKNLSGGIPSDKKSINFTKIPYSYVNSNKSDFFAFFTFDNFWNKFDHAHDNYYYYTFTYAKMRKDQNIFGKKFSIFDNEPYRHWAWNGYDFSLNDATNGSYAKYRTSASLKFKFEVPWSSEDPLKTINNEVKREKLKEGFTQYLLEMKSKNSIFSLLTNQMQEDILSKFSSKEKQGGINDLINEKFIEKVDKINKAKNNDIINNTITSGEMMKHISNQDIEKSFENKINNLFPISTQDSNNSTSSNNFLAKFNNFMKINKCNKILIVNETPIAQIKDGQIIDRNIYKYFIKPQPGQKFYYYDDENNLYWNNVKSKEDFIKKNNFNSSAKEDNATFISEQDFGQIKGNKMYSKIIPLLFSNQSTNDYQPIKLAKILTDSKGVQSIHTIDKQTGFFYNNKDIKNRKKEINELIKTVYNVNRVA